MVLCMSFIGAVVVLEAWPVYAIFTSRFYDAPLSLWRQSGITASFVAAAALAVGVFVASTCYGIRRLGALEP